MLDVTCADKVRGVLARGKPSQAPAMRRTRDDPGVNIKYWSPETLAAFAKVWNEVVEEESRNKSNFRRMYASYSKFHEEFRQLGENGYLRR